MKFGISSAANRCPFGVSDPGLCSSKAESRVGVFGA